jgi:hypothetical protein
MKTKSKVFVYGLGALLLIVIGSLNFSRSFTTVTYGDLELPQGTRIQNVAIFLYGSTVRVVQVGPKGSTLEMNVKMEEIKIPWTRYLPFYQFGKISGEAVYDAKIADRTYSGLSTSTEDNTERYAVIPKLFIEAEARGRLIDALVKTAEVRASASRQ